MKLSYIVRGIFAVALLCTVVVVRPGELNDGTVSVPRSGGEIVSTLPQIPAIL